MSLTGGRRMTVYARAPEGTPEGYVGQVDAAGFIVWAQAPGGFVPTYIAPTETFTVPANRQALFRRTIVNEGSLVVLGTLIQV